MKLTRRFIWIGFGVIHFFICLGIAVGMAWFDFHQWALATGLAIFWLGWALIIWQAWTQIPEKWEYILEVLGSYSGSPLTAGLHFIFPYFNFMHIRSRVFMGTQLMPLYLRKKKSEKDEDSAGEVDFKDGSAPVDAKVFFRIINSAKATYEIDDVFAGIEEKIDSALRAYLGNYKIDEAVKLKIHFDLHRILNGILVREDENGQIRETLAPKEKVEEIKTTKESIESWGVIIESIVVKDIDLPVEIRELRRKVLEAEKETEAANYKAAERITLAKAEEEALERIGVGLGKELQRMVESGQITPERAADLVAQLKLYDKLGDKAVILPEAGGRFGGGTGDTVGEGARFGAGFSVAAEAVKKTTKVTTKKDKKEVE